MTGIHWWSVDSPHKGPVMQKAFSCHDVIHAWVLYMYTHRTELRAWKQTENMICPLICNTSGTAMWVLIASRIMRSIKSSPPTAAYMRQWIGSALVQIMACRLFGAKPLSKPMLFFVNWTLRNKLQWNSNQNTKRKCIWRHRLRNGGHYVPGEIS